MKQKFYIEQQNVFFLLGKNTRKVNNTLSAYFFGHTPTKSKKKVNEQMKNCDSEIILFLLFFLISKNECRSEYKNNNV